MTRAANPAPPPGDAGARVPWKHISIALLHYAPRSRGARVVVTGQGGRHVVSSESYEGMTVDDPHIQGFLSWARDYYHGAEFREITREASAEATGGGA